MRIVFMGSVEFACPALKKLLQSCSDEVVGVIVVSRKHEPETTGGEK